MFVKIVIGNLYSRIVGVLDEPLKYLLEKRLTYRLKSAWYIAGNVNRKRRSEAKKLGVKLNPEDLWDGSIQLFIPEEQKFFTGMMTEVTSILNQAGYTYAFEQGRNLPVKLLKNLTFTPLPDKTPRAYQDFTVQECLKATRGIIHAATGSGKTYIVSNLIGEIKASPFIFLVLSVDLLDQAHATLADTLNEPIGRIGAGQVDIQRINVMTIQTAVRSLHRKEPKFKLDDYQYDEEDVWSEEDPEDPAVMKRAEEIEDLIRSAKGVYFDECVSGETKIVTEKGEIPISEVLSSGSRYVMTHNGKTVELKPITNIWHKGRRKTLKIQLENGTILVCTPEHVLLTKTGWKQAKELSEMDVVLFANVDVDNCWNKPINIDRNAISLGIKSKHGQKNNGEQSIVRLLNLYPYVNADASSKCVHNVRPLNSLLTLEDQGDFSDIYKDTTSSQIGIDITSSLPQKKNRLLSVLVLAIQALSFRIIDLKITGLLPITGLSNGNGQNIKQIFCTDFVFELRNKTIPDLVSIWQGWTQSACQLLQRLQRKFIEEEENLLQLICSTNWEILGWLGGFATTEAIVADIWRLPYIQKVGRISKTNSRQIGSQNKVAHVNSQEIKPRNFGSCGLASSLRLGSQRKLKSISPVVCNTNWLTITNIEEHKEEDVYDIEVESTQCFFANGILVHNCHHAAASTIKEVLFAAKDAYWRFGGSATPFREDGAEMMIQGLFGKRLVEIKPSWLIQKGYLVRPYIFNVKIKDGTAGEYDSYQKIYKSCIVDNQELNKLSADIAAFLKSRGISSLTLVQQYQQGHNIREFAPDMPFIKGDMSKKKRRESIQDMRDGKIKDAIATTLADEGLDVPCLGGVIVAGGGKSITRVYQRIGRVLRPFPGKNAAIAVVFQHDGNHIEDHGKRVKRILEDEPEFRIKDSNPDDIFNDLSEVLDKDDTLFGQIA